MISRQVNIGRLKKYGWTLKGGRSAYLLSEVKAADNRRFEGRYCSRNTSNFHLVIYSCNMFKGLSSNVSLFQSISPVNTALRGIH